MSRPHSRNPAPSATLALLAALAIIAGAGQPAAGQGAPQRNAYFGDLHVHTRYSFDAFIFNVRATPDDAYRYAKGEAIDHPGGFRMQLQGGPLDFYAVTEHAAFLGVLSAMADPEHPMSENPAARDLARADTVEDRRRAFQSMRYYLAPEHRDEILDLDVVRSAWQTIIEAAERHNDPGRFTTFIGYEYTSGPQSQNLHRNVIFRGSKAPEIPFSRLDSQNPEDLWAWLDRLRDEGIEALAIPHNSNGSNGQMFELETFDGRPLDATYADVRMRNEPLVEVTQVKGTSETHPLLSPNDEWADFELFPFRIATRIWSEVPGSYVRDAYLNGLLLEEEQGFNPYRFGLIGSSDTHTGGGGLEESSFHSKVGALDATGELRGSVPLDTAPGADVNYADVYYNLWGASGLAGVWAEQNTRDSIYDAFRRKETFATSGPRIRVRFFAGYDLPADLDDDPDAIAKAYAGGVPMGGDLVSRTGSAPRFLAWVLRDPESAPLQRLQVVKGWIENGEARERVFDLACSDGLEPDPTTWRCPDNGASVDLSDCSFSEDLGAGELQTVWSDPGFDPAQRAFYYVRTLENPTCRWSTWDALRAGVRPNPWLPMTIQERAWSSPIWYVPER